MMLRAVFFALLLFSNLLTAQQPPATAEAGLNQPPTLTVEAINKKTEILRDPGLALDNAQQVLGAAGALPAETNPQDSKPARISDPTQMTGSFSQALGRVSGKAGNSGAGGNLPGLAAPTFPEIRLVAKSIHQKGSKSTILNMGGKTYLMKEGSKSTFQDKNNFYELQVEAIENDHVAVTLQGKRIILQ